MRVVHVITRLIVGGAQENTVATVLGLAARPEFEVRLYAGPTAGPEGSIESEVAHPPGRLTIVPALVRPVHPWNDLRALAHLRRLFLGWPPEIVHTHSGKAGILGRLAARLAGVPHVVHTVHGPSFGTFQGPLANAVYWGAERAAARVTTRFVSVAEAMTRQYVTAGIGRAAQYVCIPSGFDLDPYLVAANDPSLRLRWGFAPEDVVVGKIARLCALKGHDDLFAVARDLVRDCPRLKFLLVGDGVWRERFVRLARDLGVERHVVFTGLVSPAEIPGLVGIMDVLVHLSRREGLPRALPQAMAAGRPVVAYDCDGAGEVCRDGVTGYLLRPGDREGLRQRVLALAGDPAMRERLGTQGRALVVDRFPVGRMVDAIARLYCEMVTPAVPNRGHV